MRPFTVCVATSAPPPTLGAPAAPAGHVSQARAGAVGPGAAALAAATDPVQEDKASIKSTSSSMVSTDSVVGISSTAGSPAARRFPLLSGQAFLPGKLGSITKREFLPIWCRASVVGSDPGA